MAKRRKLTVFNGLMSAFVLVVIAVNMATVTWGILASFKPTRELVTYPPQLFQFEPTLEHYVAVIRSGFFAAVTNSAAYGVVAAVAVILFGSMAAFGFGRFTFRGRETLFLVIVAGIPLAMG